MNFFRRVAPCEASVELSGEDPVDHEMITILPEFGGGDERFDSASVECDTTNALSRETMPRQTTLRWTISGLACSSCVRTVEKPLEALPYVTATQVDVNQGAALITVDFQRTMKSFDDIVAEIRSAIPLAAQLEEELGGRGAATERRDALLRHAKWTPRYYENVEGAILFSFPMLAIKFLRHVVGVDCATYGEWIEEGFAAVAATAAIYFSRQFFIDAYRAAKQRMLTMDTLISCGMAVSYALSIVFLLLRVFPNMTRQATYFFTVCMLAVFLLLGRMVEGKARAKTTFALSHLLEQTPPPKALLLPRGWDGDQKDAGEGSSFVSPVHSLEISRDSNGRAADTEAVRRDSQDAETWSAGSALHDAERLAVEVLTEELQVGDFLFVPMHHAVAADGVVVSGTSEVEESGITGETIPRVVRVGDRVIGGGVNSLPSSLIIRATHVGGDTLLANIIQVVERAQLSKPAAQKLADRVAAVFVPAVMTLALLVFLGWEALGLAEAYPSSWNGGSPHQFALTFFVAVVVGACPCALGLAAPTASTVGIGVAAHLGVLVKNAEVLEQGRRVGCVVFDKTGTLTTGALQVEDVRIRGPEGFLEQRESLEDACAADGALVEALRVVAVALRDATHPVATSVRRFLLQQNTIAKSVSRREDVLKAVETVPGLGIRATVEMADGRLRTACLGSLRHLVQCGVDADSMRAPSFSMERGLMASFAAVDGAAVAAFGLSDAIRPGAAAVVRFLRARGCAVGVVSGDGASAVHHVCRAVGIDGEEVVADALPQDKCRVIERLQCEGKCVAFVGDGINDAAALSQANVGISVGNGASMALAASDVVFLRAELTAVATFLTLSRATARRIVINLCWAVGYNVVMLPLAGGAFFAWVHVQLPPAVAATAMVLSSLFIVGCSLTLRRFKAPSIL